MDASKLVVGLVGMPGSGKSVVVESAQARDYDVIVMGDIIREETRKRGLELNPKNIGSVMLDMRKISGAGVIAEKSIPRIEQARSNKVIIDGLRSLDEAEVFRTHFPSFSLIAVHASPQARFTRLNRRHRSDDSKEWDVFHERDMRELSVGLGNAIAMAEYVIVNEDDKKDTKVRVEETLAKVEAQWQK